MAAAALGCYQSQNYKIWKQFTTWAMMINVFVWLLSIAKLQNLKAIHNYGYLSRFAVSSCYQSQNYKIWKQFTTGVACGSGCPWLLSIAKLQNLKAIHNIRVIVKLLADVVINRKTTKFESNSQLKVCASCVKVCCYQSQNYKIWKQFTTQHRTSVFRTLLLSIAKLQNLKAIHNHFLGGAYEVWVVINRKTTKFESNSQHY